MSTQAPSRPRTASEPARYRPDGFWRRNASGIAAVVLALAMLGGLGYAGYYGYSKVKNVVMDKFGSPDYKGAGKNPTVLIVHSGDTINQIAMNLKRQGIVASSKAFRQLAAADPKAQNIESGYYRMRTELPAATALSMLENPKDMITTTITVLEGWTKDKIARVLTSKIKVSSGPSFAQLIAHPTGLTLPSYANGNLEGILFPATYKFPPEVTAAEVLQKMIDRFTQSATQLNLVANAPALSKTMGVQVSPRDLLTLASIIQSESGKKTDPAMISQVFWNRLKKGMRLQSDATVVYAICKAGSIGRTATTPAERATDSPYNTYKYRGLPIGPISNPGDAAITAAMQPKTGNNIYFTLVNVATGETVFTDNEMQARKNVAKLQTWCSATAANHKMCYGS